MRDLHQIMKDIQPYTEFTFEHEDEFLERFVKVDNDSIFCLIKVSFGSDEIKFSYCLDNGKHFGDAITIDDFISWIRKVRGEYP